MIRCACGSEIDSDKSFDKGANRIICIWCERMYDCVDIKTKKYEYVSMYKRMEGV